MYNYFSGKNVALSYLDNQKKTNEKIFPLEGFIKNSEVIDLFTTEKIVKINTIEPSLEELFIRLSKGEKINDV